MRWFLPLLALMAFSVGMAFVDRHPVPLRPVIDQNPQHANSADQRSNPSKRGKEVTATLIFSGGDPRSLSGKPVPHPVDGKQGESTDNHPKWTDIVQAISAAAIVCLTFLLARVSVIQTGHIRRSMEAAESAAKAAKRSAKIAKRALVETERPFVIAYVSDPGFQLRHMPTQSTTVFWARNQFVLQFRNFGRTPAVLTRVVYKICTLLPDRSPDAFDPKTTGGQEIPGGTAITGDIPYQQPAFMTYELSENARADFANGLTSLWLTGFIRYDDFLGNHYIMGFTQRYEEKGERFIPKGDTSQNYNRREKTRDIPPPSASPSPPDASPPS